MTAQGGMRRKPVFRRIRDIANRTFAKFNLPPASGQCADCGSLKRLCYDHRNYADILRVDVVCASCNQKRGAAEVWIIDLETLRWRFLWPDAGPIRRKGVA